METANDEKVLGNVVSDVNEKGTPAFVESSQRHHREWRLNDVLPKNQPPWYKQKHLLLLNLGLIIPFLSSTTNGYDGSMLNGLQAMSQWEAYFNPGNGVRLGSLANGTTFGSILAFPIVPWLCDNTGRRFPIFFGSALLVLGAVLQAAAQNYAMFLAGRMIIGFGGLIAVEPSPLLVSELAYPTHRPIMTALYNTLWYLGATFAAWITYGTYFMGHDNMWSWRIPSLLQGFFPLLQVLFVYLLPESPRYLISKGHHDKARQVLVKYHAGGDENSPLVDFEMKEITLQIDAANAHKATGYLDFWKTKGNRHRLLITVFTPCMMQLSGNGLVSYYLSKVLSSIGITSSTMQLKINGCLMVYNWVTAVVTACFVERVGRRPLFLFSTIAMLVCFIVWTALSAINQETNFSNPKLGSGIVAMIFFYYLSYNTGLNGPPWLYITEALPMALRAKGANIMQFTTTCTLIYNGYTNPIAMNHIGWKYYFVWISILVIEIIVVYFFYPETKGYSLEEVAYVFDGNKAFGENESSED